MRTITKEVFHFSELSESAQEYALKKWNEYDNFDNSDNESTLDAFERIFPVKIKNWEIGCRNYIDSKMTCDDEIAELSWQRLVAYIWNNYKSDIFKGKYYSKSRYIDGKFKYKSRQSKIKLESCCPFTGYYMDDAILRPIIDFLNKPDNTSFEDLIDDCLDQWLTSCQEAYEYEQSLEAFEDIAEANQYEFYEDGTML